MSGTFPGRDGPEGSMGLCPQALSQDVKVDPMAKLGLGEHEKHACCVVFQCLTILGPVLS